MSFSRQLASFITTEEITDIGEFPMTFIRAPYIVCANDDVYAKRIIKTIKKHLNVNIIRLEPNALLLNLTGKRTIGLFYIKR